MNSIYTFLLFIYSLLVFFRFPTSFLRRFASFNKHNNCIWIHCSSVGEVKAAIPFIEKLKIKKPNIDIVLSVFTKTGYLEAKKIANISFYYQPLDFKFLINKAISKLNPNMLILIETEIWANLIGECKNKGVPVYLINARLSNRTYKYFREHFFYFSKKTINKISHIYCQSVEDSIKFSGLGVDSKKLTVLTNMKFEVSITNELKEKITKLKTEFNFYDKYSVLIAGSIREREEEFIINTYKNLKTKIKNLVLIIAPRHTPQFKVVNKICSAKNIVLSRHSKKDFNNNTEVYLLDTFGDLTAFYALSDIAIMGGSFENYGGHNVVEPALFSLPIIIGRYTSNFTDVINKFLDKDAIIQLESKSELENKIFNLLNDEVMRKNLGLKAKSVVDNNKGVNDKILKRIL